jgi:rhamnose utilization protein RhaD (predicted bifunctional aldolase and dehydrogenase)/NAD(P)-dependent dehydrogenase (short-subunit alcohol dehydrogenase family)
MDNLWSADDAAACVKNYAAKGVGEDLALRTYSARLLGGVPSLVMHGGGNTSVKTTMRDVYGDNVRVLCVKGSGWDLATIEPQGHPAVRLDPLCRLRALEALSDEDMVNVQRQNLLDSTAPNPSVETLLHAYLPHKFIDHTHSVAVCAVVDQPDAEAICARIWGRRIACVPYVMPGFQLAKLAGEIYDRHPDVEGLVLLKHGIFSFGATARESYDRMIDLVSAAERYIAGKQQGLGAISIPAGRMGAPAADLRITALALSLTRGAIGRLAKAEGVRERWILDLRNGPEVRQVVDSDRLADWSRRGLSTPDHIIRTKDGPAVLPAVTASLDALAWLSGVEQALAAFAVDYKTYFARNNARVGGIKRPLDPIPRLLALPGLGLVGIGKSAAEAAIVADLGEAWAATLLRAEAVGRFEPVGEHDEFDIEYWSLEQAKLGKASDARFARHVVAVTGAGGAIGSATARAFAELGAEVALLDRDGDALRVAAKRVPGGRALCLTCDVTDAQAVSDAFDRIAERFGGVDIVVSNAGAAWTGMIADLPDAILRQSFELNFFAHQYVAQTAVRIMRAQRLGGTLLFNVSKQAINPGSDFGAYGTAKAALLALVRQYALEHGAEGIRANAINPDRIRSGLLTGDMIAARSKARGVSQEAYMAGNLLGQEVLTEDVAQAFVASASLSKTTGDVTTVDGGNVAAMLR